MRRLAPWFLALTASCAPTGSTTAEGTAGGVSFASPVAYYSVGEGVLGPDSLDVLIADDATCQDIYRPRDTGRALSSRVHLPDGSGNRPALLFHASRLTVFSPRHTAPNGLFARLDRATNLCPEGWDAGAPAAADGGSPSSEDCAFLDATVGKVDVTSALSDPAVDQVGATGRYELTFGDQGTVSGTFAATRCTQVAYFADCTNCSNAGATLVPGLWMALVLLRGRGRRVARRPD